MIGNLLCWLGWHQWGATFSRWVALPNGPDGIVRERQCLRMCRRCGKEKYL